MSDVAEPSAGKVPARGDETRLVAWLAAAALCGTACSSATNQARVSPEGTSYLQQHGTTIDLGSRPPAAFRLLDDDLPDHEVFLAGEVHGIAANVDLDLALLTYLHRNAGVRYYLAEASPSAAWLMNRYLTTGDEAHLNMLFAATRGTAMWTREEREKLRRIRAFNQVVGSDAAVEVVGIDIEHQPGLTLEHVRQLTGGASAPESIDELLERLGGEDGATPLQGADSRELARTLRAATAARAYYTSGLDEQYRIRDAAMFESFTAVYPSLGRGKLYGQWGRAHVLQRPTARIETIAARLDAAGSPVAGKVLSIAYFYDRCRTLRRPRYRVARYSDDRRAVRPLVRAASGALTFFRLTGPGSPFASGLHLLPEAPAEGTRGAVTTDFFQHAVLIRGSPASRPLDE